MGKSESLKQICQTIFINDARCQLAVRKIAHLRRCTAQIYAEILGVNHDRR